MSDITKNKCPSDENYRKSSIISSTFSKHSSHPSSPEKYSGQDDKERRTEVKLTPFYLRWSFGMNSNINFINLTTKNRFLIFYASCHAGVLYDYMAKEMRLLQGHQNFITSIASDESGKWIVTADAGKDNVVIVWDSETCLPVCTLFNPHPECGTCLVGISTDAKYVLTVSQGKKQSVTFWLWTLGKETPDGRCTLEPTTEKVKHVAFSPDKSEHFMLTSDTGVYFGTWENEELSFHVPEIPKKLGNFIESVYQQGTHQALTTTSNGNVIVWSGVGISESFDHNIPFTNTKDFMKAIRLETEAINVIRSIESYIVTGNTRGHIRFYDKYLRILYWCQKFQLDSLTAINFHWNSQPYRFKRPLDLESDSTATQLVIQFQAGEKVEDRSDEYEQLYRKNVPSDATLERQPFVVIDFIVSTVKGHIGLVHFLQNKCEFIVPHYENTVTAMDIHSEKPQLCVGNSLGDVCLYNYRSKLLLVKRKVVSHGATAITSLKFAPSGIFLVSGTRDGSLWIVDPSTLTLLITTPYHNTSSPITQLSLSKDSTFLGVSDEGMCISLYKCETPSDLKITFMGKHRSHYKPIRDLMFLESSEVPSVTRFFSLGEDRVLVEYDLVKSEPENLKIKQMDRIEQSAIPLCMELYPNLDGEDFILVVNSEYKFKNFNYATKMCRKTTLAPKLDSPIYFMKILQPAKADLPITHMVFASKQQIGIQMLPLDGNPFRSVSMIGHPVQISHICVSPDNKSLFTLGKDDHTILMWTINIRAVEVMACIGGEGLTPYYCLIDGGLSGSLFQEMQDFFYYVQILNHGEHSSAPHVITNKIPLCDLTDLMRAIGFYPTEKEIQNMIHEVNYSKYSETGRMETEVTFESYVKLYINHHPAFGISITELKDAFDKFVDGGHENRTISRNALFKMLRDQGECFSYDQIMKFMNLLLPKDELIAARRIPDKLDYENADNESLSDITPEAFTYSEFVEDLLGIPFDYNEDNPAVKEEQQE